MFVTSLLAVAAATTSLATAQAPPEAIIEDSLQKRNESACGYFFNDQYKDTQGKKDQPDHGQLLQANGGCVPFVDADGTINRDTKYVVVKNNAACLRCTFWADPTCTKVPEELPPWWKYKYFEITDTSVHSIPYQIYQYVKC